MKTCKRCMGYAGKCKEPATPGFDFCAEHSKELCGVCNEKIATCECTNTSFLVCGYPLCDDCVCPNHGFHGA